MHHQIIAHVDMDSFYASVEIRDDPSLIGKPVVIGSDPQNGTGRGVISTCSYEARRYGLHSGMPVSRAWHLCPHAVYIRPNKKYGIVSAAIVDLLHTLASDIEQVSIDEAYLDLSKYSTWEEAQKAASDIKSAIFAQERLTCSIGLAPARSYAKIASDLYKPDGLTVITPEDLLGILHPLPASRIPGIGKKSYAALEVRGIRTIGDLAKVDIQVLQDIFGVWAVRVRQIATGNDIMGLKERGPRQSIGRETTFDENTQDLNQIEETFRELIRDLHGELTRKYARCRTIGIRIRYTGFVTITRALSLPHPDDNEQMILKMVLSLFEEYWSGEPIRLIGIRLSGIVYPDPVQCTLNRFISI